MLLLLGVGVTCACTSCVNNQGRIQQKGAQFKIHLKDTPILIGHIYNHMWYYTSASQAGPAPSHTRRAGPAWLALYIDTADVDTQLLQH